MKNANYTKDISALLISHVHALCYNVASIVCTIALMKRRTRIQTKDVEDARAYISKECLNMTTTGGQSGGQRGCQNGGTSMPSQYFGYDLSSPAYSQANSVNETAVSEAQFGPGGYIRPAIDIGGEQFPLSQSGGGGTNTGIILYARDRNKSARQNSVRKVISHIIKTNGLTVSKSALHELLFTIDVHITCLVQDLSKHKYTLSNVKRVLELKRHAVFN